MTHLTKLKKLVILLSLSFLLPAASCRKTDQSLLENNITCYASTYSNGVYLSENGGISWYPLIPEQDDICLYYKRLFLSPDAAKLYVATTGGGLFFFDMKKGVLNSVDELKDEDISSVAFRKVSTGQGNDFEILVGKKETGVSRALEGKDNWEHLNNGLTYRDVNVLFMNAGVLFAGTINGIFRWDDASNMWMDTSEGINNKNIIAMGSDHEGGNIYAGAGAYQYIKGMFQSVPSLYKSTDNGKTWERADKGLPDDALIFSIAVNPLKPERIYLGTSEGLYRSIDGGGKWSKTDYGLPDELRVLDIGITRISDDKDLVYAAGVNGIFMAQDDEDPEWTSRSYGLGKTFISSLLLQNN